MIYQNDCIICGSDDYKVFNNKEIYADGLTFERVHLCNKCGLFWLNPRMSDEDYADYYASDLYSRERRMGGPDVQDKMARVNAVRLYDGVKSFLKNGDHLDIGCGLGRFMDVVSYRYNSTGIDPSPTFKHHKSIVGFFPEDMPDGQYDLISMIHSIEHVADPIGSLKRVKELLKPDGLFIVEYPDIGVRIKKFPTNMVRFMKAHQWDFTKSSITMLLNKCGFRVKDMFPKPYNKILVIGGMFGPSIVEHDDSSSSPDCNIIVIAEHG